MLGFVTACGIGDHSAGVPFPGNPPSNRCTTSTTVALLDPIPGASNVPTGTQRIVIASSPAIHISGGALALVPTHGTSNPKLGPDSLFGPVPSPSTSQPPSTPFASPVYYAARGFRLRPNPAYDVDVAVLGSSCKRSRIAGATFKTAPY